MKEQQKKKTKGRKKDRISNLPEGILDRILSFSDMKDVVQTSLLSRRWKDLWTSVSTLQFDTRKFMSSETEEVLPFVRFLNRVLMHRDRASTIEMFDLYWDNESNEIATHLDTWIIVALKHGVQRITIGIEYNDNLTFIFPNRLFNSSSLTALVLGFSGSRVVLPDSMGLPKLKVLSLGDIRIDDVKFINRLLSGCPVLECLTLSDVKAYNADSVSLHIKSSQLKHLEIENHYPTAGNMAKNIKLTTPGLKSFICIDYMIQEYSLGNLSSLVTASIHMEAEKKTAKKSGAIEEESYLERMMKFLIALRNVEQLRLLSDFFQVLSEAPNLIESSPLEFHNLRYLELDMSFTRRCLHALTYLLKISPNLESMFLRSKESDEEEDGEVGLLPCGLSHLKYIDIVGMKGCDNELKFLELVLKEAVVLEEMDLSFDDPEGSPDATESPDELKLFRKKFVGKLKALPKVSSTILFYIK